MNYMCNNKIIATIVVLSGAMYYMDFLENLKTNLLELIWDELHKASVTERFVALRNATVCYQKALRSTL